MISSLAQVGRYDSERAAKYLARGAYKKLPGKHIIDPNSNRLLYADPAEVNEYIKNLNKSLNENDGLNNARKSCRARKPALCTLPYKGYTPCDTYRVVDTNGTLSDTHVCDYKGRRPAQVRADLSRITKRKKKKLSGQISVQEAARAWAKSDSQLTVDARGVWRKRRHLSFLKSKGVRRIVSDTGEGSENLIHQTIAVNNTNNVRNKKPTAYGVDPQMITAALNNGRPFSSNSKGRTGPGNKERYMIGQNMESYGVRKAQCDLLSPWRVANVAGNTNDRNLIKGRMADMCQATSACKVQRGVCLPDEKFITTALGSRWVAAKQRRKYQAKEGNKKQDHMKYLFKLNSAVKNQIREGTNTRGSINKALGKAQNKMNAYGVSSAITAPRNLLMETKKTGMGAASSIGQFLGVAKKSKPPVSGYMKTCSAFTYKTCPAFDKREALRGPLNKREVTKNERLYKGKFYCDKMPVMGCVNPMSAQHPFHKYMQLERDPNMERLTENKYDEYAQLFNSKVNINMKPIRKRPVIRRPTYNIQDPNRSRSNRIVVNNGNNLPPRKRPRNNNNNNYLSPPRKRPRPRNNNYLSPPMRYSPPKRPRNNNNLPPRKRPRNNNYLSPPNNNNDTTRGIFKRNNNNNYLRNNNSTSRLFAPSPSHRRRLNTM